MPRFFMSKMLLVDSWLLTPYSMKFNLIADSILQTEKRFSNWNWFNSIEFVFVFWFPCILFLAFVALLSKDVLDPLWFKVIMIIFEMHVLRFCFLTFFLLIFFSFAFYFFLLTFHKSQGKKLIILFDKITQRWWWWLLLSEMIIITVDVMRSWVMFMIYKIFYLK